MVRAEALWDVPVPPGYLSRVRQEAWRRLVRAIYLRAVLDAAHHPARSALTREALAYLRDRRLERLVNWCGSEAGWTHERLRWHVRTRRRLRRAAQHVCHYLAAEGEAIMAERETRHAAAGGGRGAAGDSDRSRRARRAGGDPRRGGRAGDPALQGVGAELAAGGDRGTAGGVGPASGLGAVAT